MHVSSLIELGAVILGLAILARVANRFEIPSIPLYLLAGLAFGEGGLRPLGATAEFVETGSEIGLILLLFLVGLEYSASELIAALRGSFRAGLLNLVLTFPPGAIAALLLGWGTIPALFLGGITFVTSSGVMAKIMNDHAWIGNRETPLVLSITILEDLAMAVYLPILGAFLIGGSGLAGIGSAAIAIGVVAAILAIAVKIEVALSRFIFNRSDEALLLTILGSAVLAAGLAEAVQISAAVGALLAGIILSGPAAESARGLLSPLRDLFAAIFFAFVGLSVDPGSIPPTIGVAVLLAIATIVTQSFAGWLSAAWAGIGPKGRARASVLLLARGEFSLAIAELAVAGGLVADLAPLTVTYVMIMAVVGPIASRLVELPAMERLSMRLARQRATPPA
jgi:CPA2 family monovalent cation:H+ antiporter-2